MNSLAPTTTLQPPKAGGRSRFSKALPAPPPDMDDDDPSPEAAYIPRELPPFPFPPRKESVTEASRSGGHRSNSSNSNSNSSDSAKPERFNFPLPPRPPEVPEGSAALETEEVDNISQILSPTRNVIPRRPVGQPAPKSKSKSNKMKRVSSISSLLSAYSNGSATDVVNRSSQETVITKDSDPAHSQLREALDSPKDLANILAAYSSNPYGDELTPPMNTESTKSQEKLLPSLEVSSQLDMESKTELREVPVASPAVPVATSSHVPLKNDSPKPEIWRRRADSKSSLNITVPELKLPTSHGSTAAATTAAAAIAAAPAPAPMQSMPRDQAPLPPVPPLKQTDIPKQDIAGPDALASFRQQGDAQELRPTPPPNIATVATIASQPAQPSPPHPQPLQPSQPLQPLPQKPLPQLQSLFPDGSP